MGVWTPLTSSGCAHAEQYIQSLGPRLWWRAHGIVKHRNYPLLKYNMYNCAYLLFTYFLHSRLACGCSYHVFRTCEVWESQNALLHSVYAGQNDILILHILTVGLHRSPAPARIRHFFPNPAPGKIPPEADAIAGCQECTQVMPIQYFVRKFPV